MTEKERGCRTYLANKRPYLLLSSTGINTNIKSKAKTLKKEEKKVMRKRCGEKGKEKRMRENEKNKTHKRALGRER